MLRSSHSRATKVHEIQNIFEPTDHLVAVRGQASIPIFPSIRSGAEQVTGASLVVLMLSEIQILIALFVVSCCALLSRAKANLLPGDEVVGREAARYVRFASAAYGMLMLKVRGKAFPVSPAWQRLLFNVVGRGQTTLFFTLAECYHPSGRRSVWLSYSE